jgi:uncharacterized protein (DUF362 family)
MNKHLVAVGKYEKPLESVQHIIQMSNGQALFKKGLRVCIKPNIVFWSQTVDFPKYGVITTSRIIEDMVHVLKEYGVDDISIVEGSVTLDPRDSSKQAAHAYESLGYNTLAEQYGVKAINVFERPFESVDLGDGVVLNFNTDALNCDLVIDLPVMKTHSQTAVSLGIKNLKGLIDVKSRKACHSADPDKDLHFWVARLADKMPPIFTLIDGIYTTEYGPGVDGRRRRSNLLAASMDIFAVDKVGATLLGHNPSDVPHLVHYAHNHDRPIDLSDVEIVGEDVEALARHHEAFFPYNQDESLPLAWEKKGYQGIAYRKFDLSMCTYCTGITGVIMTAIQTAWKGDAWDDVEVLTGKMMEPDPTKKHTILLGKCMSQKHKDNPDLHNVHPIKGCPPRTDQIIKAFHEAGVMIDPNIIENAESLPGFLMKYYEGRPEFEPGHFKVE